MKLKSNIRLALNNYRNSFKRKKELNEVVSIIDSLLTESLDNENLQRILSEIKILCSRNGVNNDCTNAAIALLGFCYEHEIGVEKDSKKGFELYQQAAEHGNGIAQNNLGFCYHRGIGVEVDMIKALKWYRKSEEQGEPIAHYNLAYFYEFGFYDGRAITSPNNSV